MTTRNSTHRDQRTIDERILDDFFQNWVERYRVTATVEAGLRYADAVKAWRNHKQWRESEAQYWLRLVDSLGREMERQKRKAEQWLTAYQDERVTSIGTYTRRFVKRPRMRKLVRFLMRL